MKLKFSGNADFIDSSKWWKFQRNGRTFIGSLRWSWMEWPFCIFSFLVTFSRFKGSDEAGMALWFSLPKLANVIWNHLVLNHENCLDDRSLKNYFSKYVLQPQGRLVTSSRPLLFHSLAHKKGLSAKEKIRLTW